MPVTTRRASSSKLTWARVVISPKSMTKPVLVAVSQATREAGSCARQASTTASETWSQILSGWPSVTDSDVNRSRGEVMKLVVIRRLLRMKTAPAHEKGQCPGQRPPSHLPEPTFCRSWHHALRDHDPSGQVAEASKGRSLCLSG